MIRQHIIGRDVPALIDQLRFARLMMCRENRDDTMSWHRVGDPGYPGFNSPWVNVGSTAYDVAYTKHPTENVVMLRGAAKAVSPFGTTVFTLREGFRPPFELHLPAFMWGSFMGYHVRTVEINTLGQVISLGGAGGGDVLHLSFDGLSFVHAVD